MTIYGDPIEISPQEAIVQELNRTAGHVEWLRRELAEGEKSDLYQISERTGRNPDVWVALYQEERKHLLRVAKEAVAMGIEERRVALEEEKGKLIAMVLQAFITDPELALTPEQRVRTPELMRRHLLALGQFSEQQEKTPTVIEAEATLNEAQAMDEVPVDEDAWGTPDDDDEEWDDL